MEGVAEKLFDTKIKSRDLGCWYCGNHGSGLGLLSPVGRHSGH
jgi:hypothetical protein